MKIEWVINFQSPAEEVNPFVLSLSKDELIFS